MSAPRPPVASGQAPDESAPDESARAVAALDALPADEAAELLASCCGARAWVRGMLERRPFVTREALFAAADDVWWSLTAADWLEAFAHHPRIGERGAAPAAERPARAAGWSADEQRGAAAATDDVRTALAEGNREYERRFGHIYLVCATGRSAADLLATLRSRLSNDPATELRVAAGEQAKITRLRLDRALSALSPDGSGVSAGARQARAGGSAESAVSRDPASSRFHSRELIL